MRVFKALRNYFLYGVLRVLPEYTFKFLTGRIYCLMGYKVHKTARLFSSVKIAGNIDLEIGKDTFIGGDSYIGGGKSKIRIGNYCDISRSVKIISGSHEIDVKGKRSAGKGYSKDITIEDGVWIGAGAIILGGVTIGSKAIIAAGALVNQNVAGNSIVGGVPAKFLKQIEKDD